MGEDGLRMEESNFRGGKDNLLLVGETALRDVHRIINFKIGKQMNPNEIYAPNEEQTNASCACIGRGYNAPCLPATPETWRTART